MIKSIPFDLYGDLLGKPWARLGRGPKFYDCYGLVIEIYRRLGHNLPEVLYTDELILKGNVITDVVNSFWKISEVKAGSVVMFAERNIPTHMGVALDDNRFIHASGDFGSVMVHSLTSRHPPYGKFLHNAYELRVNNA